MGGEIEQSSGVMMPTTPASIPAFAGAPPPADFSQQIRLAVKAWLSRTPSPHTRLAYRHDLDQFLAECSIQPEAWEQLAAIRPEHVADWRDALAAKGHTNSTFRRKMTALRSLFSYLKTYGYTGANPAHGDFVAAPAVPRDGKTVALSPADCRRLLDAPQIEADDRTVNPAGIRNQAMLAVLAYSGCRVGELVRLKLRDYKTSGEHRILAITGKGGKERIVSLHLEAVERLNAWLAIPGVRNDQAGPLFPAAHSARGLGRDGFSTKPMTTRGVQKLIDRYVVALDLDPNVTVHSLRVTALTTARERGSDIIDLQDFAGHANPRTTLTYIRTRNRLSKSPAYVLKY